MIIIIDSSKCDDDLTQQSQAITPMLRDESGIEKPRIMSRDVVSRERQNADADGVDSVRFVSSVPHQV